MNLFFGGIEVVEKGSVGILLDRFDFIGMKGKLDLRTVSTQ